MYGFKSLGINKNKMGMKVRNYSTLTQRNQNLRKNVNLHGPSVKYCEILKIDMYINIAKFICLKRELIKITYLEEIINILTILYFISNIYYEIYY